MRRVCTVFVAVIFGSACTQGAAAADLAHPLFKAAPLPPAPVFSWTGCYIGVSGGYGRGTSDTITTINPAGVFGSAAPNAQPAYNAAMSPRLNPASGIAGGQVGCNYQTGSFVIGAETDFSWFGLKDTVVTAVTPPLHSTLTSTTSVSIDWLWTGRARAGYAFDRTLVYVTGGAAATKLNYSQNNFFAPCAGPGGNCIEAASASSSRSGWIVGGGVEQALTNNWTAKAEYLYLNFGSLTATGADNASFTRFSHSANLKANILRVGLNYKF